MVESSAPTEMTGTVITYTVIYVPTPEFAGEAPYGLAVITTAAGERQMVRVLGVTEHPLEIGGSVAYDHEDAHGAVYRVA